VQATIDLPIAGFFLEGELFILRRDGSGMLSFNELQQRLHPAASRCAKLAAETPARLRVFDVLVIDGVSWEERTQDERRAALEALAPRAFAGSAVFELSPAATDLAAAQAWMDSGSAAQTDGVIAKRRDLPYRAGQRDGMVKVKRLRTVDCVVAGFRYGMSKNKMTTLVGSLLLGLWGDDGLLHHVGHTSTIPRAEKAALTRRLEALREPGAGFTGHAPGGPSRWSVGEEKSEWEPVKPTLVVEVRYDHWSGGRIRHGSTFERWRPDKDPRTCTFDQVPAAKDDEDD
jgi:ATP-dependent DNA ligase